MILHRKTKKNTDFNKKITIPLHHVDKMSNYKNIILSTSCFDKIQHDISSTDSPWFAFYVLTLVESQKM